MEYGDLRVLEAVARHGSMNRAAVELNMVQSNVTARIRVLEEQVGTQLFDRSRRGVMLTAAGQRLLPYVRLSALLKEAQEAARDDGTPRGNVRIGALETRDIERRGRTEVEHVLGFMLKKAREADIPCHTLLLAYTHIKAFEERRAAGRLS
jgi:molybdenum-dependent DNA-binding transcriptional regulator ModE